MDYEKKYNEALKKADKIKRSCDLVEDSDVIETIETIFPELKESEDEKIRKALIKKVQFYIDGDIPCGYDAKKALAWLEKQKPVTFDSEKDDKIRKSIIENLKGNMYRTDADYDLLNKQIAWLEKQGVHNPIDNVEPKFNVGDWVTNGVDCTFQIASIKDGIYYDTNDCGSDIKSTEKSYHLWTINDTKDGDVLVYEDEISLYKHDIIACTNQGTTFGGFVYHCCYDGKRFITDSLYSLTEKDKNNIHPATKEQHDLLFQKMKESDYEWDAEKKELKKMQWKPSKDQMYWLKDAIDETLNNPIYKH